MWGFVFKFFGLTIAVMTIIYLVALVVRSARRLNVRIAEFKAEQEALKNQGGPINPYAALAEIFNEPPPPPRRGEVKRRGKLVRDDHEQEKP